MVAQPGLPPLPLGPFPALADSERRADMERILKDKPDGEALRVFAYGSAMWDPQFKPAERTCGVAMGWRRRLVVWDVTGWGSPNAPGLSLGLEPLDGSCTGHLCTIAGKTLAADFDTYWRHGMSTGSRGARWLTVKTPTSDHRAITFVARLNHPQYAGDLSRQALAMLMARAKGPKGTGGDYLNAALAEIDKMGLIDWDLKEIADLVRVHAGA